MPYGAEERESFRVLFIDDDVGLGVLVKKALARVGHSVTHVTSSTDGFAQLANGGYDVIALDHSMPGETGINVLAKLGPRAERPPVIYVTGSSDARTAVEAIKAGADDYVIKDTSGEFFELLVQSVEQVIDRWRLRHQKAENERAIREARDHAELLLKEVNHRVANSLGLVAAMVRMQANALSEPGAIRALQETQMRINAIAGVHRWLYTSEKIGLVNIRDYIGHLVADLRTSLSDTNRPYEINLEADEVSVTTDKAVSLGVIVGELITNAYKYAYGLGEVGEIRVRLKLIDEQSAELTIEDDGRGFDPTAPSHGTGLGSRILTAMAANLKAAITHENLSPGTKITIRFPAN
jgi:two-component sensor histidine kinase/CheY-like chemotaxis protein